MEISSELKEKIEELMEYAINKVGVSEDLTRIIYVNDIVFPNWTRFKCKFGCKGYGKNLCCPPFIPNPEEWRDFFKDYNFGILLGFEGKPDTLLKDFKKLNKLINKLERKAFLLGFYKAFSFFLGPCKLCDVCVVKEKDFPKDIDPKLARNYCKHLDKARPSMEATGIDVFATLKNVGIESKVLTERKDQILRFYGLILLE